jgi:hypothetical protein
MRDMKYGIRCKSIEVTEEHFHPSGSVKYTVFKDCESYGSWFDITVREEMRQA